jgi:6-pyruvoyltetrahydropterin/6-carboxytetrahydropterin synthase
VPAPRPTRRPRGASTHSTHSATETTEATEATEAREAGAATDDEGSRPTGRTPRELPVGVASLTRRVVFSAAHRYRRPEWSDERNEAVFGACARPNYHGHSYACDVTVSGPIDERTGMLVDLAVLDRALDTQVRDRFDHRNINLDVPEFAEGRLVPTGENLARFILGRMQAALGERVRVTEVRVAEDDTLAATFTAGERKRRVADRHKSG